MTFNADLLLGTILGVNIGALAMGFVHMAADNRRIMTPSRRLSLGRYVAVALMLAILVGAQAIATHFITLIGG